MSYVLLNKHAEASRPSAFHQTCSLAGHRITEWFGFKGTFKDHLAQPPCHGQGYLSPDQVAQSPIKPVFEHFLGWGIHSFSRQPVPVSYHPHHKIFLPYIQPKSTLLQFKTIASCPVTTGSDQKSFSMFSVSSLYIWKGSNKVSPEPSLLRAEEPQLSQSFFIGEVFQPSD